MAADQNVWYISDIRSSGNDINEKDCVSSNLTVSNTDKETIYLEGYVIPREVVAKNYLGQSQKKLLNKLRKKYGSDFINYIKGSFVIIVLSQDGFEIYNDRHNIKKFYVYEDDGKFLISNSVKLITEEVSLEHSKENTAIFCLFSHFIGELTPFRNLRKSKPASKYIYKSTLHKERYWNPQDLFNSQDKIVDAFDIAKVWKKSIGRYISFLSPKKVGLTLTGGNDSRMVLAGLLANNIKPDVFTYGNPDSKDAGFAKKITDHLGLKHNFHFVSNPTNKWIAKKAKKIVSIGNTHVNFHRAHRLDAVENEMKENPDLDMIFTGLVGGEYIKEPDYDDVTIPLFYKSFLSTKSKNEALSLIRHELEKIGLDIETLDLDEIHQKLKDIISIKGDFSPKQKKFLYTYYYYAVTHHSQDPELYSQQIPYVVNPFLDIDFLEKLLSYKDWYVNRRGLKVIDQVWHSYLLVKITDILEPKLSEVEYAKKGVYSGSEMLNKPLRYFFKRLSYFFIKNEKTCPQNFAIAEWLYEFADAEINSLHPQIKSLYKDGFLKESLRSIRHHTNEEKWHVVTNPINLSINLKYFNES